jgi:hypothetical protein
MGASTTELANFTFNELQNNFASQLINVECARNLKASIICM